MVAFCFLIDKNPLNEVSAMPPVTKSVEFVAKMIPTGEIIRETGEISEVKGSSRGKPHRGVSLQTHAGSPISY